MFSTHTTCCVKLSVLVILDRVLVAPRELIIMCCRMYLYNFRALLENGVSDTLQNYCHFFVAWHAYTLVYRTCHQLFVRSATNCCHQWYSATMGHKNYNGPRRICFEICHVTYYYTTLTQIQDQTKAMIYSSTSDAMYYLNDKILQ